MKVTKKDKRVIHQINAGYLTLYTAKGKGFEASVKKLLENGFIKEGNHNYLNFTEKTDEILDEVYSEGEPKMIF